MAKSYTTFSKVFKKILIISIITLILFVFLFILFYFGCFSNLSRVKFDKNKLKFANAEIETYDNKNNIISDTKNSRNLVKLENLNQYTIDSFIVSEDKEFFKHKGINYKRILKAFINNIKSRSFKEGASTISQQLIKNTHLSSEKTIKRKINELLLTQKLEKMFTKEEILESYLNVIYFGSGTFGLEQAAQKYYSKSASDLTLDESAVLAGLIKSPKKYSPITNLSNAINRRNVVLTQLYKNAKITPDEFNEATNKDISLSINLDATNINTYYNATIEEAAEILNITEKDLILDNYKIFTYFDSKLQSTLYSTINDKNLNPKTDVNDSLGIVIDNKTGGIKAYYGKSKFNLREIKRQPGSTLKPILVYAPALEKNLISPITPILDEEFKIDNYCPKNYNNKYYGWISAKESLAKSLNVPAVKILSYVGIANSKSFAKKIGIKLSEEDTGYSIALGGLTNGIRPLELANAYQTIGNKGKHQKATFIKKIVNKFGRTIYENGEYSKKIMRDDTAFLLTKMLEESVQDGTSKKLSDLPFKIAAKTGTVGDKHQKNTDIWNLSFNSEQTVCIWLGNTSKDKEKNFQKNETGARYPTSIAKEIYKNTNPTQKEFLKPDSVVVKEISSLDLENNVVAISNENTPKRYTQKEYFSIYNCPKFYSSFFKQDNKNNIRIVGSLNEDNKISISFTPKPFYFYDIIRATNNDIEIIKSYASAKNKIKFIDDSIPTNSIVEYFVIEKFKDVPLEEIEESQFNKSNIFKTFISK